MDKSFWSAELKKIGLIAGSRPEVIKLAPVYHKIAESASYEVSFCLTGQHGEHAYDLSRSLGVPAVRGFEIDQKNTDLTNLTSSILAQMGRWIGQDAPDLVITQGDTSSTFGGSLAAFLNAVPLAHVEAGLRTFDLARPFPEEGFRAMIAKIGALHFAPTPAAAKNLAQEGVPDSQIFLVGNTVVDALDKILEGKKATETEKGLILATAHRRENWSTVIDSVVNSLKSVLGKRPDLRLIWVSHPNPKLHELVARELQSTVNATVLAPLDYVSFLSLLAKADLVITDSGGIQEEAVSLGVPTLIARRSTERNEGIECGRAQLLSPEFSKRVAQILELIDNPPPFKGSRTSIYGDGEASSRILHEIDRFFNKR